MNMRKRTTRTIKGTLATALAVTPIVAIPTEDVSAEDTWDTLQKLVEKLDGIYDNLSSEEKEALKLARQEFLDAEDATWDELSNYVQIEGLTNSEKRDLIEGFTGVIYATSTDDLVTQAFELENIYESSLKSKFDGMPFIDFVKMAIQFEEEAFNIIGQYENDLESLNVEDENYDEDVKELLNDIYSESRTTLENKYPNDFEKVKPVFALDSNGLIATIVGINDAPGIDETKLLDAQSVLIAAVLEEEDNRDEDVTQDPDPSPSPTPSPSPSPDPDDNDDNDETDEPEDEDSTGDEEESSENEDDPGEPAEGEVIVDNDAVTVTKEENEEGKTVVKVELNAEEVAKGLEDKTSDQVKSIRVQVNKDSDEDVAEVSIPSEALNAVKEKNENAVVEVVTEGASYRLPVNEMNTDDLAKEFTDQLKAELGDDATELTSDDVDISVQVNEVAEEEVEENVTKNNLRPVSKVIEFKVEARTKDGSQKKEIKRFKKYVEREIEGDQDFDMTHSTGVRLNDDGTFTAVPTLFDGTKATVKSMSNSKYTIVENDKTFSDIEDTWNKETIEKLASKYIIQGKLDGTYAPKDYIKRSEFTTLISRALGLVDEDVDFEGMFPDVKEGKWYADHVEAAVDAGIIQGREDGTFDPDSYVTRNETAAMIKRAMDFVSYDQSELNEEEATKYEDYDQIAKWARDNVEILLQAEIMGGRGNGNFDPYGDINRAEMAKVLDEFLSFVKLING